MKKNRNYLFFITPAFILYSIFVALPIVVVFGMSLTDWTGMGDLNFIGLKNFVTVFTDPRFAPEFFNALKNNLKYLLCVWLIITPFQYLVAYLLFIRIPAHKYLKFMVFLPYVISTTIVSFFATLLFNPNIGLLNEFLKAIGGQPAAWFGDEKMAFKLLVMLILWQGSGSGIMIFYANFMDIPEEVMEAFRIGGCTEWQRFWYILFPLSLPSCASNITMSTIWALAIFDLPYILGGINGGINGSLDFANLVFYRYTFGSGLNGKSDLGFGAAIVVVMFIVMMAVTLAQNKVLSKFEYDT